MTSDHPSPRPAVGSRVIAHRGGAANAPENTIAAFRSARRLGVEWVEVDVSLLGDGTAVLFHDAKVDRCTNGRGPLSRYTLPEIEKLDAGSWFGAAFAGERVPTLARALAAAAELDLSLNLELKAHGGDSDKLTEVVIDVVESCRFPYDRLLASCFDHAPIEYLYTRFPVLPRGLLFETLGVSWREAAERCRATSIVVDYRRVRSAEIFEIRATGCDAYVYTANEPRLIEKLWDAGLTGVITDRPQRFLTA
jgi:glycerophosphoryl diester phosphodiesterase